MIEVYNRHFLSHLSDISLTNLGQLKCIYIVKYHKMNKIIVSFLITASLTSCNHSEIPEPQYQQKWILEEAKIANGDWQSVSQKQSLNFYFITDSTLTVQTDSSLCNGTYSIALVNNSAYDKVYTVKAECITPEDHMWWTYQIHSTQEGFIEALPRLNPTAYLNNVTYRFRIKN